MYDEVRFDQVSRVVIFGGKAAPGYYLAKQIIKLINTVAEKVNNDPDISGKLYVIYVPDYNVSLAELLMPASDISQHISTAGMEASGTGNMKFTMNGGIILGTMDGANVELYEHIGEESMFIFGTRTEEVEKMRKLVRERKVDLDPSFLNVIELLRTGYVGVFDEMYDIINSITNGNDYYLISVDWPDYLRAQEEIDKAYKDQRRWTKMSVLSSAGTGFFSSDRSIGEYAKKIWNIEPIRRPGPIPVDIEKISTNLDLPSRSHGDRFASLNISLERIDIEDKEYVKSFSPNAMKPNEHFYLSIHN